MNYFITLLYIIISIINIMSQNKKRHTYQLVTKPMIIPLLILLYITYTTHISPLLITALIFGWLGDVVIIFYHERQNRLSFLVTGLLFFLLGHFTYILIFVKDVQLSSPLPLSVLILFVLSGMVVYIILIKIGLLSKSDNTLSVRSKKIIRVMVILYMMGIMTMSYFAFLRFTTIPTLQSFFVFLGSLFFLSSDTILSFKEFAHIRLSEKFVMITYILAQTLITIGLII